MPEKTTKTESIPQTQSTKKVKLLKGLQRACLTVTAAGLVGMILSMGGNSEKHKKLSLISSVAGAGSALGALYAASKRATMACNDFMEALERYETNSHTQSSQSIKPSQHIQPPQSIQYIQINHDQDSYLDDPYLEDPYINDTR
jgi:hypothetical protein